VSWAVLFVVALLAVLASWWNLVRLCEHDHPRAGTVVLTISSAFLCTTVLSVSILALLRLALGA
jgi:hypothetical protein